MHLISLALFSVPWASYRGEALGNLPQRSIHPLLPKSCKQHVLDRWLHPLPSPTGSSTPPPTHPISHPASAASLSHSTKDKEVLGRILLMEALAVHVSFPNYTHYYCKIEMGWKVLYVNLRLMMMLSFQLIQPKSRLSKGREDVGTLPARLHTINNSISWPQVTSVVTQKYVNKTNWLMDYLNQRTSMMTLAPANC